MDAASITAGPAFRVVNKIGKAGEAAVAVTILKRIAGRAGLDAARVSGHSCRVGMAQDLSASGADMAAIQQVRRWKTAVMPARYVERIKASRNAVTRYYHRRGE